jgi:hypothetical protein
MDPLRPPLAPLLLCALLSASACTGVDAPRTPIDVGRGWVPSECEDGYEASLEELRRRMREARRGSPEYAPHPFPATVEEVVADFMYGYVQQLPRYRKKDFPEADRLVYERLRSGDFSADWARVENWTSSRCLPEHAWDFFHLLRIRSKEGDVEILRGHIHRSGLLGGWSLSASDTGAAAPRPAGTDPPDLQSWVAAVQALHPAPIEAPQYVRVHGIPGCASVEHPCLAYRSGGTTYIAKWKNQTVYELRLDEPGYTSAEFDFSARQWSLWEELAERGEFLASVGRDRWVVAVPFFTDPDADQRSGRRHVVPGP